MHDIDKMLLLSLEGKHDEAWEISEKLEKLGPDKILDVHGKNTQDIWLRHCFNRGWHLVQKGEFQKGFQLLECGRYLDTYGGGLLKTDKPIFNPEVHKSKNKSVILSLEGGYGDEIIHVRFATHLKKIFKFSKVYIACDPSLSSLFARIESVDGIIDRSQAGTVDHDYWIPGFSAAWICGFDTETLPNKPYLSPNIESINIWKSIINTDKKKVGIRWAGNPKFEHQQFRTFNAQWLIQMANAFPDIQFYSFQRDNNLEQLPENIVNLDNLIISWEDTAAAILNMDLMISSCTSVAHLAAALGKETWVITPILPYHTWAEGAPGKPGDRGSDTSIWYNSIKVYRQIFKEKWQPTFEEIYEDFELKFNLKPIIEFESYEKVNKSLNLGCGFNKINGFLNVDVSPMCNPDMVVDLEKTPWPFEKNEFSHIVVKDILEHLKNDFSETIKEMYRISDNGAVWEIQVPHPKSDLFLDDPTHVKAITAKTLKMYDKLEIKRLVENNFSESYLAFIHDVDINVMEVRYVFNDDWVEKVNSKEITEKELYYALNHYNNVAASIIMLIQVHKPGRVTHKEFIDMVTEKEKNEIE